MTIPPGGCCFIEAIEGIIGGAGSELLMVVTGGVDADDDQSGKKSIKPEAGFKPPVGVDALLTEEVVVAVGNDAADEDG